MTQEVGSKGIILSLLAQSSSIEHIVPPDEEDHYDLANMEDRKLNIFDDFPDNSIPELEGLLSSFPNENTSNDCEDFTSKDSSHIDLPDIFISSQKINA